MLATSLQDYCSESLCDGARHIACKNDGVFSALWPTFLWPFLYFIRFFSLVICARLSIKCSCHSIYRQIKRVGIKNSKSIPRSDCKRKIGALWESGSNGQTCKFNVQCGNYSFIMVQCMLHFKVWNDELAKLAEYNVRRCIFGHDECRNTGNTNRNIFNLFLLSINVLLTGL